MFLGYAGNYASGFPDLAAMEDLLGRMDATRANAEWLFEGEHVSGPAANEYRARVDGATADFEGTIVRTNNQARSLLANANLQVYEGKAMTCFFNPHTAKCRTTRAGESEVAMPAPRTAVRPPSHEHARKSCRPRPESWTQLSRCPGEGRTRLPSTRARSAPRFPWEIPVESDALVGEALAVARPAALTDTEARLNGLQDAVVAERYQALRALVWERAGGHQSVLERLLVLEESDAEVSWTRWQTSLSRCGVNDDAVVIEAARAVWQALGPNAYALHFKHRPRTWRGFQEGRTWLQVGVLGCVALIFAAFITDERAGVLWWIWLPAVVGWPLLVWRIFSASYRRRARVGGRELPHL